MTARPARAGLSALIDHQVALTRAWLRILAAPWGGLQRDRTRRVEDET